MKALNIALGAATGVYNMVPEREEAARPLPWIRQLLRSESFPSGDYFGGYETEWFVTDDVDGAELVSSRMQYHDKHMPVLDIDAPCRVVQSSPGRSHVYIDVPMTWRQYRRLLKALVRAGVVEKEWAKLAYARRWSSVRPSWKLKGAARG